MATFDLIDEPWIPVLTSADVHSTMGLREIFKRAHQIRGLNVADPLEFGGIFRLLLALGYRIEGGPANAQQLWDLHRRGRFEAEAVDGYLDAWRPRFDLFSTTHPFFQVAGFATINGKKEEVTADVSRLHHAWASGNNNTLFDHRVEGSTALAADQAARVLLAHQYAALGGGKGPTSNLFGAHPYAAHAPGVGGVFILVEGANLFEWITRNLIPFDGLGETFLAASKEGQDVPVWERNGYRAPGDDHIDGVLDYLTYPARYLRLIPEEVDGALTVRDMFYAQGLVVPREHALLRKPWMAYRKTAKDELVPLGLSETRALWRDSYSILRPASDAAGVEGRPYNLAYSQDVFGTDGFIRLGCFGLVNDKAKPILWRSESLPVPPKLLSDPRLVRRLEFALEVAKDVSVAVQRGLRAAIKVALTSGKRDPDPNDVSQSLQRLRTNAPFWAEVEPMFHRFIKELPLDEAAAVATWHTALRRHAYRTYGAACIFLNGAIDRRLQAEAVGKQALVKQLSVFQNKHFPETTKLAQRQGEHPS